MLDKNIIIIIYGVDNRKWEPVRWLPPLKQQKRTQNEEQPFEVTEVGNRS